MRVASEMLRHFDLNQLKYPLPGGLTSPTATEDLSRLSQFIRDLEILLPSWSNNLASRYFSHARTLPITIGQ
jgi:hypothetical protein